MCQSSKPDARRGSGPDVADGICVPPCSRRLTSSNAPLKATAALPSTAQLLSQTGPSHEDDLQASATDASGGIDGYVREELTMSRQANFRVESGMHRLLKPVELCSSSTVHRASAVERTADTRSSGAGMEDGKSSDSGRPNPSPPFPPLVASGQATHFRTKSMYPSLAAFPERAPVAQPVRHGFPTIGSLPLPPIWCMVAPMSPRAATLSGTSPKTADVLHDPLPSQPTSFPGSVPSQYVSPQGGSGFAGGLPQSQTLVGQGSTVLPPPLPPGVRSSASHSSHGRLGPLAMSTEPPRPQPLQRPPPLPPAQEMRPDGQQNERPWGSAITGSVPVRGWPRGLSLVEALPILAITPQSGEEILIPVDTHQGSKSADERRQRGACASRKFRSRKKERSNQMEEETRQLNALVRGLEQQRDFYRDERNRLRDIVSRTPSISEHANGPPTPTLAQSTAFFDTENRPLVDPPRRRTHAQSNETSSIEPLPPRKRRADGKTRSRWRSPPYEPHPTIRSSTVPAALRQAPQRSTAPFPQPGVGTSI
jgi:hypothetical protein